jgi:glycerol uptake facilitator-like aquaporin
MLGTMTFLYIVSAADEDVFVGLGLFTSLCFFGSISGGNFNPAVTVTQIICAG